MTGFSRGMPLFSGCVPGRHDPLVTEAVSGVPGARVEIAFVRVPGHTLELIEYSAPADRGAVLVRPCGVGVAQIAFDVNKIYKPRKKRSFRREGRCAGGALTVATGRYQRFRPAWLNEQ